MTEENKVMDFYLFITSVDITFGVLAGYECIVRRGCVRNIVSKSAIHLDGFNV